MYYLQSRTEMLPFVPLAARRILDVGCAAGAFGRLLMQERNDVLVSGVEPDPDAAATAAATYDAVATGRFPDACPPGTFDCVVFNDVLEHMVDPWQALRYTATILGPRGVVVASIPNVRYWPVLQALVVRGRWDYTDDGVLDRTHLRWFTRHSITDLFTSTGYHLERIDRLSGLRQGRRWRALKLVARDFVDDVTTQQYAVVARRATTVHADPGGQGS